jgi:hypothetical protein
MKVENILRNEVMLDVTGEPRVGPHTGRGLLNILDVCGYDPAGNAWLEVLNEKLVRLFYRFDANSLENGGGFCAVRIQTDFIKPYLEVLEHRTGCKDIEVAIENVVGVFHTHIAETAMLRNGILEVDGVANVYPYSGEKLTASEFEKRAAMSLAKQIEDRLGETQLEREFIPAGDSNLYKPNPKYATGQHKIVPHAKNEAVWQEIFKAWAFKQATEAQMDLLRRYDRVYKQKSDYPSLLDGHGFHIDGYTKFVKWEDFLVGKVSIPEQKPCANGATA